MMVVQVAAKSDKGCFREKNEDSFFVDSENGIYVICDGVGGHLAGEVASRKAVELTVAFLRKALERRVLPRKSDRDFVDVFGQLVVEAIESCCNELIRFAESRPELEGMATTITLVFIVEGVAFVGHIGDTRLYLKHGDVAKQLTVDHTLFEEFTQANPEWLYENGDHETLKRFRHILTRCAGRTRDINIDSFSFQLANEDVLLMCSDGLSNYFENEQAIVSFLAGSDSVANADSLIDFAVASGGSDNVTAIVIRVVSLDESEFDEFVLRPDSVFRGLNETTDWPCKSS